MRLRKTLAYGDGETRTPQRIKTLAFSYALVLPLLASCSAAAVPASRNPAQPILNEARRRPAREAKACASDIRPILQEGERVVEAVCRHGKEYVMTDRSLLVLTRGEEFTFDPIALRMHVSRTDMGLMRSRGIVDWEAAEDAVYVLTREDRMLTRLPNEAMGATVPAYQMPFDVSGLSRERMVYHSGFLFIAPAFGNAMAFSYSDGFSARLLPFGPGAADAGFSIRGGRLYFGKSGQQSEIRVDGSDISLQKK